MKGALRPPARYLDWKATALPALGARQPRADSVPGQAALRGSWTCPASQLFLTPRRSPLGSGGCPSSPSRAAPSPAGSLGHQRLAGEQPHLCCLLLAGPQLCQTPSPPPDPPQLPAAGGRRAWWPPCVPVRPHWLGCSDTGPRTPASLSGVRPQSSAHLCHQQLSGPDPGRAGLRGWAEATFRPSPSFLRRE